MVRTTLDVVHTAYIQEGIKRPMDSLPGNVITILLIEDNPGDARLVQEMFKDIRDVRHITYDVRHSKTLAEGIECLQEGGVHFVLLDLSLPDSSGLDTLSRLIEKASDVPVAVLTGLEDEAVGVEAIEKGAQDYLVKSEIDANLLARAVRYGYERFRLLQRLEDVRQQDEQARQKGSIDMLQPQAGHPAQSQPVEPLRERTDGAFAQHVARYGKLLDLALEQSMYKVAYNISEEMYALGDTLGRLCATPRDVIDVHLAALDDKLQDANARKKKAYSGEGRILLVQLMGRLAMFYRRHYVPEGHEPEKQRRQQ